jgi:hypothetical protein
MRQVESVKVPAPTVSMSMPLTGLGGMSERIVMRPRFEDADDPRNKIPPGGIPGKYRVVFTFARPGHALKPERDFSMDPDLLGDSHLAICPPAVPPPKDNPRANMIEVTASTDSGEAVVFLGHPNQAGFLGRLVTTISARDFRDADLKAYQAICPSLSHWSAHLDVPFWIWRAHVTELVSGAVQISVSGPFRNVPFALRGTGTLSKEFRAFASLYREGLSTNSPAYAFLCFFKIAEGVRKRRQRIDAEILARGEKPSRPVERLPEDRSDFVGWLNAIFPIRPEGWDEMTVEAIFQEDARGRKINDLLDKELVDLRNAVGHALSDESGEPTLVFDDALHVYRLNKWLPLMRCIPRRMLKNEFPDEFLSYLKEDGSVTE